MTKIFKVSLLAIFLLATACNEKETKVKITDKNIKTIKRDGDIVSLYMIYTDVGVFKNEDNYLFFKWNSSDIYGNIEIGKCYIFKTRFWRNNFFSLYPNIMSIEKTECNN